MFIGPVGCGKSSLLRCILGEIPLASGAATASSETIAYCDQTPWLQNTTIRNNIVAQSEYSPSWYREVLHTCALDEDIVQLSAGDQTQVGTGGCNLSGGQRQRVVGITLPWILEPC
jgi:ABC-type bacteriocin/lantibiotic exporter with double-glycine peptidase domain